MVEGIPITSLYFYVKKVGICQNGKLKYRVGRGQLSLVLSYPFRILSDKNLKEMGAKSKAIYDNEFSETIVFNQLLDIYTK